MKRARRWVEQVRVAHARWALAAHAGSYVQVWPHCEFAWVGDELFLTTNMNGHKSKPLLLIASSCSDRTPDGHYGYYLRGDGPFHKLRSAGVDANALASTFFGIGDLLREWDAKRAR